MLPGSPFTNLSGSQESGTGESDSGHSRYMCTGPGCKSGHVRLTMACNIIVGRDCALPLAGSTSPDFDCRGFHAGNCTISARAPVTRTNIFKI